MKFTETIRLRVDPAIKAEAVAILEGCGMDVSTAIRMFLCNIVAVKGVSFEMTPNAKTVAAIKESRSLKGASYASAEDLFKDLEKNKGTTDGKTAISKQIIRNAANTVKSSSKGVSGKDSSRPRRRQTRRQDVAEVVA